MFSMKRNQVILTALVVMIAVAGYLNYVEINETKVTTVGLNMNDEKLSPIVLDDHGNALTALTNTEIIEGDIEILSVNDASAIISEGNLNIESTADNTAQENLTEEIMTDEPEDDAGSAIFVTSNVDNFFIQAKLVREQDRSKQKELITELINNDNIESEQKAKYADEVLEMQKRIEKESATEAMIEAKGFKEVYVRIDDTTVDVVIGKEELSDAEIAQIEDIIKRKTGIEPANIRISTIKK